MYYSLLRFELSELSILLDLALARIKFLAGGSPVGERIWLVIATAWPLSFRSCLSRF